MKTTRQTVLPLDHMTQGEQRRLELASRMSLFASETIQSLEETDLVSGSAPVECAAKAALLCHSGVAKAVRLLASVAATAQAFELRNFHRINYPQFVIECETEIEQATDSARKSNLLANLNATKSLHETAPACRAELISYAKIHRQNTDFSADKVIKFCRRIVSDWIELIPSEEICALSDELDRLASADLSNKLRWLGLSDFDFSILN